VRVLTHGWWIATGGEGWRRRLLVLSVVCVAIAAAFGNVGAAGAGVGVASGCPGASSSAHGKRFVRALLCLHDAERRRHGLGPLRMQHALRAAAKRHARDMVGRRYFDHVSPAGTNPVGRAVAHGYRARRIEVRENILTWSTSLSAAEAMRKWMASPPHRSDILGPRWRDVGIAFVRSSTSSHHGLTVVVEFGRRYR
jgi:uncharacterized protein YkwD